MLMYTWFCKWYLCLRLYQRVRFALFCNRERECNVDVNECDSNPCQNGAACVDSGNTSLSYVVEHDTFTCLCTDGYAHGICDYTPIDEYSALCAIVADGTCDADVNECESSPCANGAVCSESSSNETVPITEYRCTCVPGTTNGWCAYNAPAQYALHCNV